MALQLLNNLVPAWWDLPGELAEPLGLVQGDPVAFRLRPLDGEQYGEVADHFSLLDDRLRVTAAGIRVCLAHGLVDWRGIAEGDGEVAYSPARVRLLPHAVRMAIAGEIIRRSELDGDQVKN